MIREQLKQLKSGAQDLQKFGVLVGAVFNLLALWFWWRHKVAWPWLLVPGVPLWILGLVCPTSLRRVYLVWMALALALRWMVSTILLILLFCLVVAPTGMLARAFGQDFLRLKLNPKAASYWLLRDRTAPEAKRDYERQF